MSRIMEAWNELLREAVARDFDEQQFALFRIGLVLQRHNPQVVPDSDIYEESLSRELLRLTLNHQRQTDTITYLLTLVENQKQVADSILFALGNAQPQLLVGPLSESIVRVGAKWNEAAAHQAVVALNSALQLDPTSVEKIENRDALYNQLESWEAEGSDDLSDRAAAVLDFLDATTDEA